MQNWWQPANLWCAWLAGGEDPLHALRGEHAAEPTVRPGPARVAASFVFRHAGAAIVPGPAAATAALADGTAPHRIVETVNSVDLAQFDPGRA